MVYHRILIIVLCATQILFFFNLFIYLWLCYTVGPCCLSIPYIIAYIC